MNLPDHRSKNLRHAQAYWIGKRVEFIERGMRGELLDNLVAGIVEGVGDDGHRCDHDGRRKWKFTGLLFVHLDDGRDVHIDRYHVSVKPIVKVMEASA